MGSFKDQTVEGKMSPQIYRILVNNLANIWYFNNSFLSLQFYVKIEFSDISSGTTLETEEKKKKSRVFKEEKKERKRKREKTKWHELWVIKVTV